MKMQPSPVEVGYLILAFVASGIVWLIVLRYKLHSEPENRGSWYERNVNSLGRRALFSVGHFALAILIIWFVMVLFAPSYFPELLGSTWIALPMFICMGLFVGILSDPDLKNRYYDGHEDTSAGATPSATTAQE
jgi:hypothetical protein